MATNVKVYVIRSDDYGNPLEFSLDKPQECCEDCGIIVPDGVRVCGSMARKLGVKKPKSKTFDTYAVTFKLLSAKNKVDKPKKKR